MKKYIIIFAIFIVGCTPPTVFKANTYIIEESGCKFVVANDPKGSVSIIHAPFCQNDSNHTVQKVKIIPR